MLEGQNNMLNKGGGGGVKGDDYFKYDGIVGKNTCGGLGLLMWVQS